VLIGLTEELRQLEYSQRLVSMARNVVSSHQSASTGRALFDGALRGGSQALGVAAVGLIEGALADIVSLDAESVVLAGRSGDAIIDSWIFGAPSPMVDCVWARGRKVVKDGRHIGRDMISSRFRRTIEGLLSA
jgi:cytosine/adenosine deaminase-related metal-dependent hydrolase